MEEPDREAHGELVEADRDPERKQDETATGGELGDPLALVPFFVKEHPTAEQGEHSDREVIGGVADQAAECVPEPEAKPHGELLGTPSRLRAARYWVPNWPHAPLGNQGASQGIPRVRRRSPARAAAPLPHHETRSRLSSVDRARSSQCTSR